MEFQLLLILSICSLTNAEIPIASLNIAATKGMASQLHPSGICLRKILDNSELKQGPVGVFLGPPPENVALHTKNFATSQFLTPETITDLVLPNVKATDIVIFAKNLSFVTNAFFPPNATQDKNKKLKALGKKLAYSHKIVIMPAENTPGAIVGRDLLKLQTAMHADYLVYAKEEKAQKECIIQYVCLYCCEGSTCVKDLTVGANKSLSNDVYKWSVNGATLRSTYIQFYKNWFIVGKTKEGRYKYDGSDYRLVEIMRKHLNFTIQMLYEDVGLQPGTVDKNGTWNGIVGAVQRKEVDFTMTSLAISYDRAEHIDFAMPYEFSGFHLLQGRPTRRSTLFKAIFAPFSPLIWGLIIVAIVLMTVSMYLLERFGGRPVSMGRVAFFLSCLLVSQAPELRLSQRKHANVLVASWVCFATFIPMCYTALYYGYMVVPMYEKPVESLTDLINSNQRWFAYVTTVMMTYAKYKPLGDKAIYRTWEQRPGDFDLIKNNPGVYSTMLDKSALNNKGLALKDTFDDFASGKFYISRYPAAEYWKAMGVQSGSPLLGKLAPVVLRMFESGICSQTAKIVEREQKMGSVSFDQMRYNQAIEQNAVDQQTLNLIDHLLGAFAILAGSWVLGIMVLWLEIANFRAFKIAWLF